MGARLLMPRISHINVAIGVIAAIAAGAPAVAHHSTIYFDTSAEVVHENARVVEFHVANPHGILVYAVTDGAGDEVVWNAELPSANFTMRAGIFASMLSPGDVVPVVVGWPGLPGRTREHFTRLKSMTMANGDMATFTPISAALIPAGTE